MYKFVKWAVHNLFHLDEKSQNCIMVISKNYNTVASVCQSPLPYSLPSVLEEGYLIEEGGLAKFQKRYKRGVIFL